MIAEAQPRILWLPGTEYRGIEEELFGSRRNPAGVRVDPETAIRATAVLACVRVLASGIAGLPLHIYRRLPNGGKALAREIPLYRTLHAKPNGWQTSYEWRETLMLHLLTHGNAYCEIRGAGKDRELIPLHPSRMKVERIETGRLRYVYREATGGSTPYPQEAIMHLRWLSDDGVMGLVPTEIASDAIGLSRACEIHGATFFGNGARPGGVLSTPQILTPEAADFTKTTWRRAHGGGPRNAHEIALLMGDLKYVPIDVNNSDSQFLETRRFQIEEVCRVFGVVPHLAGDLTNSSYANIEQQSIDHLQQGLMPWIRRFESAITRDLIGDDDELFAEFDIRGALRADAAARSAFYNIMAMLGVFSVNEIRGFENMEPVEGGDLRLVPLNMQTLEQAAALAWKASQETNPTVAAPQPVAEGVPAAAGAPDAGAAAVPQVADVSLNGGQITGLIEIIKQVPLGVLTKEAAAALIKASFPSISEQQAAAILAGVPETMPAAPPAEEVIVSEQVPARSARKTRRKKEPKE